MNKVEIKGTVYSYGVSSREIEICLKNQEGFFKVVAVMSRQDIVRLGYGVEVYIKGRLRGFDGLCYIVADVVEFV